MKEPDDDNWMNDPNVREWVRARSIVNFFISYRQRETVNAFLRQYDGPMDHDSIRDAFRRYAPEISS